MELQQIFNDRIAKYTVPATLSNGWFG